MVNPSDICVSAFTFSIKMAASGDRTGLWLAYMWTIWQIKFNDSTPSNLLTFVCSCHGDLRPEQTDALE